MEPKVVVNQQTEISRAWYKGPKIIKLIFLILAVVILVELFLGVKKLFVPTHLSPVISVKPISDAQLSLLSDKKSYKVGDKVIVNVKLSTSGHNVLGTDLILRFDPKILQAPSTAFTKGNIFADYPQINVDSKNGVIYVSGVSGLDKKYFNGIGFFGTITFQAQNAGKTSLNISFSKGATDDTNVFEPNTNEDILGKVYNLTLSVQ